VTGKPLFYPRSASDVDDSLAAFARNLRFAGLRAQDTFLCSLPIGIHPAGQQMVRAAELIGAATVWAGAGNQTPSATQIELLHDLGVTVWCGMASFGLQLAHLAEGEARPLAESGVHTVMTTAEMLSSSKRALLAKLWGARVVDLFGMSEIGLMGAECGRRPGLHVWRDDSFCEVLDPDTHAPVEVGAVGVLCVTPVSGGTAIPFVRWLSGDVVRMEYGCECEAADQPRVIHSGRTLSFFKVKGVNLGHPELEEALYAVSSLLDFRVLVEPGDRLLAEVECEAGESEAVRDRVEALFVRRFGVRAEVAMLARGTIARSLEGQLKAQRFVDRREA
jgi:phenylacetate-CoA ligase